MPNRGARHKNNKKKPTTTTTTNALHNCPLPGDILADILTRLPVKSLFRFRCVCKPFLTLITNNPKFAAKHLAHTFKHSPSLIIEYTGTEFDAVNILFPVIVNIFPLPIIQMSPPIVPVHPSRRLFHGMEFVGCVNGLLCFVKPLMNELAWWNPATRWLKIVDYYPEKQICFMDDDHFAGGFGYDEVADDYKFVRIVRFENKVKLIETSVEVYSVNKGKWKRLIVSFPFRVIQKMCNAIVRGNPYFAAFTDEEKAVVLEFDVRDEVFRKYPLKEIDAECEENSECLADFKDELAMVMYGPKTNKVVEIHVLDKKVGKWNKKLCVGTHSVEVRTLIGCVKTGQILVLDGEGELYMIDHEKDDVKHVPVDKSRSVYKPSHYSESLVALKGMVMIDEDEEEPPPRNDFFAQIFREVFRKDFNEVYGTKDERSEE